MRGRALRLALVGPAEHRDQGRGAAVGQPHLLPVDHVITALTDTPGADRTDVRAQARLRHRERAAYLAGGHPRQEVVLLRLGSVLCDHVRDDEVGVDDAGNRHPAARDLLHHQGVGQQRLAEAAVLLRDHEPEQAHLLHALDDGGGVLVPVLQFGRDRDDLLVDEVPHGGEDVLLDLGESFGLGEASHGWLRG